MSTPRVLIVAATLLGAIVGWLLGGRKLRRSEATEIAELRWRLEASHAEVSELRRHTDKHGREAASRAAHESMLDFENMPASVTDFKAPLLDFRAPDAELAMIMQHAKRGARILRSPHKRLPRRRNDPRLPLGLGRVISPAMLDNRALMGVAGALSNWRQHQSPEEFFVREILPRYRTGHRGPRRQVVLDVGANVGQFALAVARRGDGLRAVCFEPLPATCATLQANLQREIGEAWRERAEVHCAGVGSQKGWLPLAASAASVAKENKENKEDTSYSRRSASFTLTSGGGNSGGGGGGVPVLTLDSMPSLRGEEILLLKSDTQGFDANVLQGATSLLSGRRVHLLLIEMSNSLLRKAGSSPLRLMRKLDGMGYACTHLSFWARLRDDDGRVKFKPLNRTHVPRLLLGRHSIPFEEMARALEHLPPLNSTGWTDLLCW